MRLLSLLTFDLYSSEIILTFTQQQITNITKTNINNITKNRKIYEKTLIFRTDRSGWQYFFNNQLLYGIDMTNTSNMVSELITI